MLWKLKTTLVSCSLKKILGILSKYCQHVYSSFQRMRKTVWRAIFNVSSFCSVKLYGIKMQHYMYTICLFICINKYGIIIITVVMVNIHNLNNTENLESDKKRCKNKSINVHLYLFCLVVSLGFICVEIVLKN